MRPVVAEALVIKTQVAKLKELSEDPSPKLRSSASSTFTKAALPLGNLTGDVMFANESSLKGEVLDSWLSAPESVPAESANSTL